MLPPPVTNPMANVQYQPEVELLDDSSVEGEQEEEGLIESPAKEYASAPYPATHYSTIQENEDSSQVTPP